ncbi:MAG: hypothetical protein ACE5FT_01445 [Candidatus Nanoarchaeia archaeon]
MRWQIYLLVALLCISPVAAYTGTFGVMPPLSPGPSKTTNTKFELDTEDSNPQTIITNLIYVQSIVVETNPEHEAPLHVKERPEGGSVAFSITVPKPINDDLVEATIFFWGPDVPTLTITHDHNGAPPVVLSATKVQPTQTNSDGNVLWSITVNSFSDFYTSKPEPRPFPWDMAILLFLASASCVTLVRY